LKSRAPLTPRRDVTPQQTGVFEKRCSWESNTHLNVSQMLKMIGAIPLFLHTPSWDC